MKTYSKLIAASAITALTLNSQAATYLDSTGETISGAHIDITSVEVNHTATDLIFKINLNGDPVATDWGKYTIGFDTTAGGDSAGNGWARPISMPGMDYWIGTWADSGNGANLYNFSGVWNFQSATSGPNTDNLLVTKDSSSLTVQFNYAGLGLTAGSSFLFDVYTTGGGGGDGAIDALGNPAQSVANWGDSYNSGALVNSYTIPAVPEPTSLALLGIGATLVIGRLRRR